MRLCELLLEDVCWRMNAAYCSALLVAMLDVVLMERVYGCKHEEGGEK